MPSSGSPGSGLRGNRATDAETERIGCCTWITFLVGNATSAAAVLSEVVTFDVCFEEDIGHIGVETTIAGSEIVKDVKYDASTAHNIVVAALVIGLFFKLVSVFILSCIYRSPLDITSMHKISPNDLRSKVGSSFQFILAPVSWAIVYFLGGAASILFSLSPPCEGQDDRRLDLYLVISGGIMTFGGLLFLVISVVIFPLFACGSPMRCTNGCCARARENIHKYVLSLGVYFDTFWQLQGVVWAYRMGVFGVRSSLAVGALSIVGEALSSCSSASPVVTAFIASAV